MFNQIARLHRNESGNESMQTVMIMAVGALIMIGVHGLYSSEIGGQVKKHITDVISKNGFGFGATGSSAS